MSGNEAESPTGRPRRLVLRKQGRLELVPVSDVLYVQGADNYVELVLRDGRRELHDSTLQKLAAILPEDFQRIHKSYLVRLSAVRRIRVRAGSQYAAELDTGAFLPVGRTHYQALLRQLAG
jgi:DNA-binding LytR/AlgR family response regulator